MGELTRADYQSRVLLTLGNVPTSHPVIAAGIHTSAIDHAPNRLIRENPDYFPEHHDRSWTIGPTIVTNHRIELPENLIVLERVRHSADEIPAGSPPSDWSAIAEQPVSTNTDVETIGLLAKSSSETGYPTLGARKANDLNYWPTTQTSWTTYFRVYGISGEIPLASAGATFRMHRDYDQVIVYVAASEVAFAMGRYAQAKELLQAAREMSGLRIGEHGLNVMRIESARRPIRFQGAGIP